MHAYVIISHLHFIGRLEVAVFRSFVYVNEAALRRYAEQLAIGEKKIAARKVSLAAKAGPLQAGAEFEPDGRNLSLAYLYDEFEKALEGQPDEYYDFLTGSPDALTLPPMSIARFRGTAEVPAQFDAIAMMGQYVPMLEAAGILETEETGVPKEFLHSLFAKKDAYAPLVINGLDIPVFAKVGMTYFTDRDISLLEEIESDEAVFLIKVLAHYSDEQVAVYDPLRDFMNLSRAARRSMDRNSDLDQIRIAGPAIKGELIAVYH